MRICTKCNQQKELTTEFFALRENGLFRRECRICDNKARQERQAIKLKEKRELKAYELNKAEELFKKGYKVCTSCKQECLLQQFNKQKFGKFGLESTCKNCKQSYKDKKFGTEKPLRKCRECGLTAWKSIDLELFAKAGGNNKFGRYNICKSCHNNHNTTKQYNTSLEKRCKKFNITVEQYNTMISNQNNSCAICKKHKDDFSGRGNNFHIDHCHNTGKVRGLLCSNCNTGLGQFKDSLQIFENAIQYILKNV